MTGPSESGVALFSKLLANYLDYTHIDSKQTYTLTDASSGEKSKTGFFFFSVTMEYLLLNLHEIRCKNPAP